MKNKVLLVLLVLGTMGPWACQGGSVSMSPLPLPAGPSLPQATPTPTVNLNPVCGSTPVAMPSGIYSLLDSGVQVIHDSPEWNQYASSPLAVVIYPTPQPTPTPIPTPVDFTQQMLVVAAIPQPCYNTTLTITDVCEGPSQVTVYVDSSSCASCPMCNMASRWAMITSAVAVPQSSLPVSVVYSYSSY